MKKITVFTLLLFASTSVMAHGWGGYGGYHGGYERHEYHGGNYGGGYGWVAPLAIGGLLGYELSRPQPQVIYQQAPVVVQQQPQIVVPQQPLYRKESIYDQNCGCYKEVFVQIQ